MVRRTEKRRKELARQGAMFAVALFVLGMTAVISLTILAVRADENRREETERMIQNCRVRGVSMVECLAEDQMRNPYRYMDTD